MSIVLAEGRGEGAEMHRLERGATIGRSRGCELRYLRPAVSRRHAQIFPIPEEPGRWAVLDLSSHNGTRVNGVRLGDTPLPLSEGDVIDVQGITFTVHYKE